MGMVGRLPRLGKWFLGWLIVVAIGVQAMAIAMPHAHVGSAIDCHSLTMIESTGGASTETTNPGETIVNRVTSADSLSDEFSDCVSCDLVSCCSLQAALPMILSPSVIDPSTAIRPLTSLAPSPSGTTPPFRPPRTVLI